MISDSLKRYPLGHKFGTDSSQPLFLVEQATLKTKHLGTNECHLFRKKIFEEHSHLSLCMASSYLEIATQKDYIEANRNLLFLNDRLIINDLNLSASADALKQFADNKVTHMKTLASTHDNDDLLVYQTLCDYVSSYSFEPPKPSEYFGLISSCINRICCPRWWRKKFPLNNVAHGNLLPVI